MHWRTHPDLQGKLHPSHPDDLQVIVHDGGPRLTERRPELVWVTITGFDGDIFTGRILNAPANLTSLQLGQGIRFILGENSSHPVMVTEKYLSQRSAWQIHPCAKCGFPNLFDAPSDLIKAVFPNLPTGAELESFSTFCPLCGGVQLIEARAKQTAETAKRPWWKFW
jgi:hypothetical protein